MGHLSYYHIRLIGMYPLTVGRADTPVRNANRKSRCPRTHLLLSYLASVAHLVEQLICNQQVVGSSPTGGSHYRSLTYRRNTLWIYYHSF